MRAVNLQVDGLVRYTLILSGQTVRFAYNLGANLIKVEEFLAREVEELAPLLARRRGQGRRRVGAGSVAAPAATVCVPKGSWTPAQREGGRAA